jgi:phosphopantetheinyl transferase
MNAAGEGWLVRSIPSLEREYGAHSRCWLHPAELAQLERFRSVERRASWLWGRVVAKRLVASCSAKAAMVPPWSIEIRSRSDDNRLGIAPTAWIDGECLRLKLSIAHAGQLVAAACVDRGDIGIDVLDRAAQELPSAELWAIKEAAFKCLPAGTPFQPGQLKIELAGNSAAWAHLPSQHAGRAQLLTTDASLLALAWRGAASAFTHAL